jgi:hypothetical protein
MNVKEIILEKMKSAGADGLCNSDGECGCGGDGLFDCYNEVGGFLDCQLAKMVLKKDHCKPEDCESCIYDCDAYAEACITDAKLYIPLEVKGEPHEQK